MALLPETSPFTRFDRLMEEMAVLTKAFALTLELPRALKEVYDANRLLDDYSDYTKSVEGAIQMAAPDAQTRLRQLRGWIGESQGPRVNTVPFDIEFINPFSQLEHMRAGWDLLVYFQGLLRTDGKKFPEWFMRDLELVILDMQELKRL